ncbi:hypothetical protein QTP88_026529 [Uroleucon formosanum]
MAQSKVWQFLSPNTKNTSAAYNLCNQVIKHSKSTTCLWNHYNSQHKPENGVDVVRKRVRIDSDTSDVDQNGEISEQMSSNTSTLDSDYSNCVLSTSSSSSSSSTPYHYKNRSELITQSICNMICEDMLPINTVGHSGFKNLMNVMEPSYNVPCRKTITTLKQGQYNEKVDYIKEKLMNINSVSLSTDFWTSRNVDSYITVTGHFINNFWQLEFFNICTKEITHSHMSENLFETIQSVITEWKLDNKVQCIRHDNVANITIEVKMMSLVGIISNPCAAHSLQLCIKKALDTQIFSTLIKRASSIVSAFKHSYKRSYALENALE